MKRIRNVAELREALECGHCEFRVLLNGGLFSRKTIFPCTDGTFSVWSGVDGTMRNRTEEELWSDDIIGEAMRRGAFVAEDG